MCEWQPLLVIDCRAVTQVSPVSCKDDSGLPDLIDRIAAQGATSVRVPPAWGLALKVIDALRGGEDPLQAAREHLHLSSLPTMYGGDNIS